MNCTRTRKLFVSPAPATLAAGFTFAAFATSCFADASGSAQ